MAFDLSQLRRGAIAEGVFPFAAQFPMTYFDDEGTSVSAPSVRDYVAARRGRPTRAIVEVKMRPVLLLHDGTRGGKKDVACLRINSVKSRNRSTSAWSRVERNEHPFFFHLPVKSRYRLPEESIVSLTSLATINKTAIAGVRGSLSAHEMQMIGERLRRVLSLDLSPQIAEQARELLRRAGLVEDS